MKLTISGKLAIGTGLLLALFIAFGTLVYTQVREADRELEVIATVHMPVLKAVAAIESDLASLGYHALGYLHGERQIHLERLRVNREELTVHIEDFRTSGAAAALKREVTAVEARQRELSSMVDRLIRLSDEQGAQMVIFVKKLAEIDDLLDKIVEPAWTAQGAPAHGKLVAAMELEININGMANALGSYLRLPVASLREAFNADVGDCARVIEGLEGAISDGAEKEWVKKLTVHFQEARDVGLQILAAEDTSRADLGTFVQIRQALSRETLDPLKESVLARFEQGRTDASSAAEQATRFTIFGILAGLLVGGLVAFVTARTISAPLRQAIARLASSSAEIQMAMTEQASGAEEQASAVSQSVSTVDELQHISEQASQRVKAIVEMAHKTESVGEEGSRAVAEANRCINQVRERVETVAGNILSLAERMQAIGEIIATVNDMADQTNLLALNASIEASRAGVEGKGFAVVAREVKSLADQSKGATGQVRKILQDIQKATNDAVLATEESTKSVAVAVPVLERAGQTIDALSQTISEAAQMSVQAMASAGQQSTGMAQIQQAMRSIDQATRQNLSATRQVEQAARDLGEISQQIGTLVGRRGA
ncbi:MAG: methyl-accepting chemotaxis protein [Pseudomonadota bacterium]